MPVIVGQNGRRLILDTSTLDVRGEPNDRYNAILDIESGTVSTLVREYSSWLPRYFHDLSNSWRGWAGEKTFESLEGELLLSATHDGLGTVELWVTLRKPTPPSWSASASLDLGAGADLEAVAKSISDWVEQR